MATTELGQRDNGAAQKQPADNIPALYARLCLPMPTHKREVSGRSLDYISGQQCIQRLNDTLGVDRWSFAIVERWHETDSDCCCVRGVLTVQWPEGATTHHQDIGGQIVNRRRSDGVAIEIANDWKGARTDCLKRCAADLGIGLWLYGNDMPAPESEPVRTISRQAPGYVKTDRALADDPDTIPSFDLKRDPRAQFNTLAALADELGIGYLKPTTLKETPKAYAVLRQLVLEEEATRAQQAQLIAQEATY